MTECDFCDEEFENERELHIHWLEEHEDELNSHKKEKAKKAKREKEEEEKARKRKLKRKLGYGAGGIIAAAFVGFLVMQLMQGTSGKTIGDIDLESQPVLGNDSAEVTIVEFADFYCPACEQFNSEVKPQLKEDYIDTGQVKLVHIDFPLSTHEPQASAASRAAECVYRQDEEQFWNYNEALFNNQRLFDYNTDGFMELANQSTSGLDNQQLRQCIENSETADAVSSDKRFGLQNSVSSTPSVYVNGEYIRDWSYGNLESKIQSELE